MPSVAKTQLELFKGNAVNGLDSFQRMAVLARERNVLIKAGPGSGKTRVIVHRAAYLVRNGAEPSSLCIVTFSKRAAEQLERRITAEVGEEMASAMRIGTLHSIGYEIIRYVYRFWNALDNRKRIGVLKQLFIKLQRAKNIAFNGDVDRSEILREVLTARRNGVLSNKYAARVLQIEYEEHLRSNRLVDFDDMVHKALYVLKSDQSVLRFLRSRWKTVLLDEAQDVSAEQWEIVRLLVGESGSLFAVGDAAQSIYGFRGAKPEIVFGSDVFAKDGRIYYLPTNYRSTSQIVGIANILGSKITHSVRVSPNAQANKKWGWMRVVTVSSDEAEAQFVFDEIEKLRERSCALRDIAILTRLNAQLGLFEQEAAMRGVPCVVHAGSSFFSDTHVEDIVAYLKIGMSGGVVTKEVEEALNRVYHKPLRGIGEAWLALVNRSGGWQRWVSSCGHGEYGRFQRGNDRLFSDISNLMRICGSDGSGSVEKAVRYIYDEIGYRKWWLRLDSGEQDAEDTDDALMAEAILNVMRRAGTVQSALEIAAMCRGDRVGKATGSGRVQLMTIHKAKGLEFPVVFVVGIEDKVFPHRLSSGASEMRVLYVALTRAENALYVTTRAARGAFAGSLSDIEVAIASGDSGASSGSGSDDVVLDTSDGSGTALVGDA